MTIEGTVESERDISRTDQARKADEFRALHIPGAPLVLFNVWDAGSAKAVTAAGVRAIATGSWSVAHAHGFDDGEEMPLALVVDNLRRIVSATDLPVSIDLESGYGDAPELVGRRVIAVVNFPPKRIGPFVSEVLVLGAYDDAGEVVLLALDQPVRQGARIG